MTDLPQPLIHARDMEVVLPRTLQHPQRLLLLVLGKANRACPAIPTLALEHPFSVYHSGQGIDFRPGCPSIAPFLRPDLNDQPQEAGHAEARQRHEQHREQHREEHGDVRDNDDGETDIENTGRGNATTPRAKHPGIAEGKPYQGEYIQDLPSLHHDHWRAGWRRAGDGDGEGTRERRRDGGIMEEEATLLPGFSPLLSSSLLLQCPPSSSTFSSFRLSFHPIPILITDCNPTTPTILSSTSCCYSCCCCCCCCCC